MRPAKAVAVLTLLALAGCGKRDDAANDPRRVESYSTSRNICYNAGKLVSTREHAEMEFPEMAKDGVHDFALETAYAYGCIEKVKP